MDIKQNIMLAAGTTARIPGGYASMEYLLIKASFWAIYCKKVRFPLVAGLRRKIRVRLKILLKLK